MRVSFAIRALLLSALFVFFSQSSKAQDVPVWQPDEQFVVGKETDEVFFGPSIDVRIHAEGDVYVVDHRQNTIYSFSNDGRLQSSLGEEGRGPGEFTSLRRAFIRGNRLVTYGGGKRQVTVFSLEDGSSQETIRLGVSPSGKAAYDMAGTTGERHLIEFIQYLSQANPEPVPVEYRWLYPDGTVSDIILEVPFDDQYIKATSESITVGPLPFGRRSIVTVDEDNNIYAAHTGALKVRKLSPDGKVLNVIEAGASPIPVTDEDIERRGKIYTSEAGKEHYKRLLKQAPDTWPLFRNMLVDTERIWLDMVTRDRETRTWLALNDAGEKVATFTVPENVRITSIRGSRAAGVLETDEGAQLAVSYTLRPRSTP
jgi:hypothetical protein